MGRDVLYDSPDVRITYLHSPEPGREGEVISAEDHELWLRTESGKMGRYIIQRGILRELADAAEDGLANLLAKLSIVSPTLPIFMPGQKVTLGQISDAIKGAYRREQEIYEEEIARENEGL